MVLFDWERCSNLIIDTYGISAASVGGGFLAGILIGWALKKVMKILAIIAGLFLAGLAFLQYQKIAVINWNKLEQALEGAFNAVIRGTKMIDGGHPEIVELAVANFGISVTSSTPIGFIIGFMKG
jgi:uncharacterized membrane protein (Fun14 family)